MIGVIVNVPTQIYILTLFFFSPSRKIRVEKIWDILKLRLVFVMVGIGFTLTMAVL
jgi:hypothetical protein